jgi:VWFA-related protein
MRPSRQFIIACTGLMWAQQLPTFRVPVRLVSLPVLVFNKESHLIAGLGAEDFRVLDNGTPQMPTVEASYTPLSVALAIQVNRDVREYLPFVAKSGSVVDALLAGEHGEAALVTYGDEVEVVRPFSTASIRPALQHLSAAGKQARMLDACVRAVNLLAQRPAERSRVLLVIGQAMDRGSASTLEKLRDMAEKENVAVYGLALPQFGKAFVSDTFTLEGVAKPERGGYRAGADLSRLTSALDRSGAQTAATDPFSVLTAATGGLLLHFRKQRQLEDAMAAIGVTVRSAYVVSYYPSSRETGYHSVGIRVGVANAKVYARRGYWRNGDGAA